MRLSSTHQNEFGETQGIALFPYFGTEITVICRKGVSPEYTEKCLKYLEEVDEELILQICKYAEFFLKDTLENTSVGDLEDGEAFPYDNLLDLLQYFRFDTLYIDKPPQDIAESPEVHVLNLSGGCEWREDDGIQCLVKDGEVLYLGDFYVLNIWQNNYSENYYGNYVLYESLCERRKKWPKLTAEDVKGIEIGRTQRFFDHWNTRNPRMTHKLKTFADALALKENLDFKGAIEALEDSYLYQLMNEYPQLLEESIDFWYECFCIEKEKDPGALMQYICENIEWDMF